MAITAAMVKELREMTGVGMLDCKKALAETDGDMDKAVELLREKGLAASAKNDTLPLRGAHSFCLLYCQNVFAFIIAFFINFCDVLIC